MIAMLAAALAMFAAAPVLSDYEGIARDDFAAWSYTTGKVTVNGQVRTTSVMARYNTPTQFTANPTPVAYSIHTVQFDCAGKTATYVSGANYSASGVLLYPANPAAATPWSDFMTGFQQLATTVCSTNL